MPIALPIDLAQMDYNLEHLSEAATAAEPMLYFLMIDLFDLLN